MQKIVTYIRKGPKYKGTDGQIHQRKVGVVVGLVDNKTLRVGWSLCNSTSYVDNKPVYAEEDRGKRILAFKAIAGDRFNSELGISLATGRAMQQHKFSANYMVSTPPTCERMMLDGVPQSAIAPVVEVIQEAMSRHGITKVIVYSDRQSKAVKQSPLAWNTDNAKTQVQA